MAVVDADLVAREVVLPDSLALNEIIAHFGPQSRSADGTLDRAWLRAQIFNHPHEKVWLEALLHPLIRNRIRQAITNADSPYVVLVSPLLLETDQAALCDRILLIDAPVALQIARASARDQSTATQIQSIIAAQWPREKRQRLANDIILNDKDMDYLYDRLGEFHQHYLQLATGSSLSLRHD